MAPPSRYHLVVFVLIYFLPLVVMFMAYSVIGLTLWKRAVPRQQAHGANLRHLQAKKKVRAEAERAGPAPGATRGLRSLPTRGHWRAHNRGHSASQKSRRGTTDLCHLETNARDRLLHVLKVLTIASREALRTTPRGPFDWEVGLGLQLAFLSSGVLGNAGVCLQMPGM